MNFEKIVSDIQQMGLNLYDFALYTPEGIFSHYFQPCNNCNNSYSVAKAFITTAIGLLFDDGKLSPSDLVCEYFADEMSADCDPKWARVTIHHALTHSIGFGSGFLDIDTEDAGLYPSEDYLSIILSHPLKYEPGEKFVYSDAAFCLLARLVAKVSGEDADILLQKRIFRYMNLREVAWSRCPLGHPVGATGLYISAADMVKLGALYLQGGVWNGRQLLSREWVDTVVASGYEFRKITPGGLIGKGGMCGQMLLFCPEKGFAAAWHAHIRDDSDGKLLEYLDNL